VIGPSYLPMQCCAHGMTGGTGVGAMADASAAKLQALIDTAQRRIDGLQREIGAGRDNTGRKTRQLQRLELYEFVVTRLNRGDALMPEVISAQTRDR